MPAILIADDHPLFRTALKLLVGNAVPSARLLEAATLAAARAILAADADIDLVLLDLHLPDSHGLMGLAALRGEFPAVAVAMVSAHENPATVRRALAHGACAWLPKRSNGDEIAHALQRILSGEDYLPAELAAAVQRIDDNTDSALAARLARLSPQQFRVLEMVAEGLLNKQIADRLGVQERTIKAHLTAIFERLDVRNRTQAGVLLRALEVSDPADQVSG
ncbi:MAG TPA: response regulator transcription factor [Rhodanobacteraceae bacterium]|nr:response regulator transcription factor [Rhodanobacteraceae bacterium]